jgi:hypothetical protein
MTDTDEKHRGLLLALMEPSPTLEEEFQDWYDSEHFPERVGTDGFLTANRLICVDGWPRYLALYDLTDVSVLNGESYARIAGGNYSRWTQRIVPRVWGHYRAEGVQIYPGAAMFGDGGRSSRTALWRFRSVPDHLADSIVAGLRTMYEGRPETAQVRIFRCRQENATDYVGIVELHAPLPLAHGAVEACGEARRHIDLVSVYTCYQRA